jgi:hypothetical protein
VSHLYRVESRPIQMWDALLVSVSSPHPFFFPYFLFSLLFFFSHSHSRPRIAHSQSQNIKLLVQIIYLTITYNSYKSHKLQDSQHILDRCNTLCFCLVPKSAKDPLNQVTTHPWSTLSQNPSLNPSHSFDLHCLPRTFSVFSKIHLNT